MSLQAVGCQLVGDAPLHCGVLRQEHEASARARVSKDRCPELKGARMPTVGAGETSEKRAACRRRGTAARAAATSAAAAAGREALLASGLRRDHVRRRKYGEALAREMEIFNRFLAYKKMIGTITSRYDKTG